EAELLLGDALRQEVAEAASAVLLREHERRQAELGRPVPDLPRHLRVGLVHGGRDRTDLALGEVATKRLDLALLVRQLVQAADPSIGARASEADRDPVA